MDDLIRRSALLGKSMNVGLCDAYGGYYGNGEVVLIDDIKAAPPVDAVEVVRCKECKFCKKHPTAEGYKLCTNYNWNNEYHPFTEDEHFCSYGKRRSE